MEKPISIAVALQVMICIGSYQVLHGQQAESVDTLTTDTFTYFVIATPVTVHASSMVVPFTIATINQADINQLTAPTIEPLLNATPGLWMQSGALNTNRISIRGVGYREPFATTGIKIYLDEIPLTNGVGESSIEDIHPHILSGIDIWRGPSSALWGSGLGGMIHLKSQVPNDAGLHTRIQVGSFDRLQFDQHFSTRYGKEDQWGTALHYQYLNDSGFRDNNHYRKNSFTWMQQWRGEKGLTLNSFIHGIGLKAFIPSSLNLNDFENNPSSAAPTWAAVMGNEDYTKWITGLNAIYAPSAGWVYRGSVFGTFFDSDEVRPFNVLEENSISTGMRHRFTLKVKDAGHITMGLEYFNEHYAFSTFETLEGGVPGQQLTDESESRTYLNTFVQTEWSIREKWYLFGGLNLTLSRLSNEEVKSIIPVDLFPTAGITYSLHQHWSASTSISRGYSALGLEDILDSDGMVNSDIIPETGWSEEISIRYEDGKGSYANLTLFNMNIRNTVLTRRIMDDVFEKINGGSSVHQGVELGYVWNTIPKKMSISGAYTYGNFFFDEFEEAGSDYSGNQLPGAPMHRLFTQFELHPWQRWSIHLEHHLVSSVYLNDANTLSSDGYQLINTGLSYEVIAGDKWSGVIAATVHNVFDVQYSPMVQINAPGANPRYYYPGKPRSFYLNLTFSHKL